MPGRNLIKNETSTLVQMKFKNLLSHKKISELVDSGLLVAIIARLQVKFYCKTGSSHTILIGPNELYLEVKKR